MAPRRNPARRNRQRRRAGLKSKFHGAKHSNTSVSGQFARVVETWRSYTDLSGGQSYTIAPTLADAQTAGGTQSRVARVAQGYRYYRVVSIKHEFRPYKNVAAVTGTDTLSIPNLYYLVKKDGGFPAAFNQEYLVAQGAKPVLFNRSINVSYKPQIILNGQVSLTQQSPTMSSCMRWVPTINELVSGTANLNVPYYGMCFIIADNNGGGGMLGEIYTTVVVEYKQPNAPPVTSGVDIDPNWNAVKL